MVEHVVQRLPQLAQAVEIDAHVSAREVLVHVQYHLETVTVHAPARMPWFHARQAVRRLEAKAPPQVRAVGAVDVDTLVARALHADRVGRHVGERVADPARDVLVGGHGDALVEVAVIQRRNDRAQPLAERRAIARTHRGQEAVAVQASRTVSVRQHRYADRRLEGHRGNVQQRVAHGVPAKRASSGSARPACSKPLARSRQESQPPQGRPSGAGS